jgi:hypothetical protein
MEEFFFFGQVVLSLHLLQFLVYIRALLDHTRSHSITVVAHSTKRRTEQSTLPQPDMHITRLRYTTAIGVA